MKLVRRLSLALALWAAALAAPAGAASIFDPAIDWRTIVTPHFRVNYPAEYEAMARLAAGYAEEAHQTLSPWLDSVPEQRTELTLLDSEDTVNGFGFPLPNNQIFIYLTSPPADELMGKYDSWLRDLLMHEYTHVLHMEKTAGYPALLKRIVGRSYFPNMIVPIFMIEGLAVHTETKHSTGGRGRDTAYQTYLRMAALEDKLAGIDQASGYFTIDHPGGEIPYVYGMAFYKHLAARYGADAPARLAKAHASNVFAGLWGIDDELQAITGKTATALWAEMGEALKADARLQRDAVLARGPITPITLMTAGGMQHRHPRFMPDGELVWTEWTGHGYGYLVGDKPDKKTAKPRRIITKGPYGPWDVSPDGRYLYHSRNWDDNRFTGFTDAFRWDTKARKIQRLSTRARYDQPAVSGDGRWVVAVENGGGQTNLVKLRADGTGKPRALTHLADRTQFSQPAWHPRRDLLAVSAWRDGSRDLYLVSPQSGAMTPLWRDRATDQDPVWTRDGKHLLFASDREGVYNLYAYKPGEKRIWRVTNVLGGVLEPTVSADGQHLAVSSYGVKGWDVGRLAFAPKTWTPLPWPAGEPDLRQPPPAVDVSALPAQKYDPLPSLRPKTWAPFGFQDERGPVLGFQTFGQDILMRHYLFGAFGMGLATGRPFYSLGYSNDVFYPSLYAYAMDSTLLSAPVYQGFPVWVVQRGQYQGFSATFPGLPSIFLQNANATGDNVTLGFSAAHVQTLNAADVAAANLPASLAPVAGQTNAVSLTYKYADAYRFSYSISPEGGTLATLGVEQAMAALGSQQEFSRVFLDWRRYQPLPWAHHALGVRLMGGANVGGKQAGNFYLGGADSASLLSTVDLRTASSAGTRSFPLRGYGFASQAGANAAALTAEWRFPLLSVQRGLGIYPLYLRNLHGAVFMEAGEAWTGPFDLRKGLLDVGMELRAQTHFSQAPSEVRVGLGQGLLAASRAPQWPVAFLELGTYF